MKTYKINVETVLDGLELEIAFSIQADSLGKAFEKSSEIMKDMLSSEEFNVYNIAELTVLEGGEKVAA